MKSLILIALLFASQLGLAAQSTVDLSKDSKFVLAMNILTDHFYDEDFETAEILYGHWVKNFSSSCTTLPASEVIDRINYEWGLNYILEAANREDLEDHLDQLFQKHSKEYYFCNEVEFTSGRYSEGAYKHSSVISKGNKNIRFTLKTLYVD
ncbi:MAG: hypothetical protein HRT45_17040 [Bdellovibrionales bacterium]|nr:hypothetical protein [Bdellovibrionales bacterium]